jgi:hypothetical protein
MKKFSSLTDNVIVHVIVLRPQIFGVHEQVVVRIMILEVEYPMLDYLN